MPTNRLIITWEDNSSSKHSVENESIRCTSEDAAQKALSKRNKKNIRFATFWNNKGLKKEFTYNDKRGTKKKYKKETL